METNVNAIRFLSKFIEFHNDVMLPTRPKTHKHDINKSRRVFGGQLKHITLTWPCVRESGTLVCMVHGEPMKGDDTCKKVGVEYISCNGEPIIPLRAVVNAFA